jgi:FkbM family methyltransferase
MPHRFDDRLVSRIRRAATMVTLYRNPLSAYRHRLGRGAVGPVTYELRSGARLTMDAGPADVRIINEIWLARCYETNPRLIPTGAWTVVDLGANKGAFAARVLHLAPEARVICYEPDPHNLAYLRVNVGDRAEIHQAAVSSHDGAITLHQVPANRGLGSIVTGRLEARGAATVPIEVPLVSLREVITRAQHVDLLKIDVEGAEYSIILDTEAELFMSVDRIVMEYDAQATGSQRVGADLAERLRALGYTVDEGLGVVAKGYGARIMQAWR